MPPRFACSGPCFALALEKTNAISDFRDLIVTSLRPKFGTSATKNAVHGSDSGASARRELRFHFPALALDPLPNEEKARLRPALAPGGLPWRTAV